MGADKVKRENQIRDRLKTIHCNTEDKRERLRMVSGLSAVYMQKDVEVLERQMELLRWVLDEKG